MFESHSSESDNTASHILQAAKNVGSFMLRGASGLGLAYFPPTPCRGEQNPTTSYDVARFRAFCQSDAFEAEMASWLEE